MYTNAQNDKISVPVINFDLQAQPLVIEFHVQYKLAALKSYSILFTLYRAICAPRASQNVKFYRSMGRKNIENSGKKGVY